MICERVYDEGIIRALLTSDEIFERISEDGMTKDDLHLDMDNEHWLLLMDATLVGAVCLKPMSAATVEMHVHIIEDQRDLAVEALKKVYKYFMDTDYKKITGLVPVIFQDVIGFVHKVGFVSEGINRASYKKGGVIIDQHYLGITRDEVKEFLGDS